VDWIHLAQNMGQLEGSVKHGNINAGFINCSYLLGRISFSTALIHGVG
jgi:hypothetical protein